MLENKVINELKQTIESLESFQSHMNDHGTLPKQIKRLGDWVDFRDNRACCSNFALNTLRKLSVRAHFGRTLKTNTAEHPSTDLKEYLFLSFACSHTPQVSVFDCAYDYMDYPVGGEDEFDLDMEDWAFWENKKRHALVDFLILELRHIVETGTLLDTYNILEDDNGN